jgi:cytoskeletal protein CcmA (bactofilin family)
MNLAALLFLILVTAVWYTLSMLPALRELWLRTDVKPLRVISEYDGNVAYFARSSLAFISANFPGTIIREQRHRIEGVLDNGTPYMMIPYGDQTVTLPTDAMPGGSVDHVIIAYSPLRVPNQMAVLSTLYAARDLIGGNSAVYRAVFGDGDIWLAPNSIVLRWIHCEGALTAQDDCKLYGRMSSATAIQLGPGSTFQRVAAPRIELGEPSIIPHFTAVGLKAVDLEHLTERSVRRHVARHSVLMAENSFVGFDVIASGDLRLGASSWVAGSLKAEGDIYIEPGARIDGSVVAGGNVFIGKSCLVRGPVIAEAKVLIDGPARIGSPLQPSTVTAPKIYCSAGVVVYGSLWARESGRVEQKRAGEEARVVADRRVSTDRRVVSAA